MSSFEASEQTDFLGPSCPSTNVKEMGILIKLPNKQIMQGHVWQFVYNADLFIVCLNKIIVVLLVSIELT